MLFKRRGSVCFDPSLAFAEEGRGFTLVFPTCFFLFSHRRCGPALPLFCSTRSDSLRPVSTHQSDRAGSCSLGELHQLQGGEKRPRALWMLSAVLVLFRVTVISVSLPETDVTVQLARVSFVYYHHKLPATPESISRRIRSGSGRK